MIKMEKQKVFVLLMLRFAVRFRVKIHVILLLLSMYSKIYWSKRSVSDIELKAFSTKLLSDENKFKKGNKRKEVVGINAKFVLLVI